MKSKQSGSLAATSAQRSKRKIAGGVGRHMKQATADRKVLREVVHLVRFCEVSTEGTRTDQCEGRHQGYYRATAVIEQQAQAQTQVTLGSDGHQVSQIRHATASPDDAVAEHRERHEQSRELLQQ